MYMFVEWIPKKEVFRHVCSGYTVCHSDFLRTLRGGAIAD